MSKLFSTAESAEYLHVSVRTFKYWIKANKISPVQRGARGAKFYSEVQLEKLRSAVRSAIALVQNVLEVQPTCAEVQTGVQNDSCNSSGVQSDVQKNSSEVQNCTGQPVQSPVQNSEVQSSPVQNDLCNFSEVQNGITSEKNKAADKTADYSQVESTTIYKNSQQKFDISEQIAAVKRIDPQILLNRGVLYPARKDGIICLCGNGSGEDGTGIKPYLNPHNVWTYHCFKCGKTFTNVDYLANYFHLDLKNDFVELIKKSCETFNISFPEVKKIAKNYTDYYKFAQSNLVGWLKSIGEKWRGLTVSTLQHFNCGFANSRVIIPYNKFHYLARAIHNGESDPKKHHGSKSVFNISAISLDAPTLILEGEIDVMSVWQATNGAVSAIAVGGIGEYKMLVRELNKIYEHSETKPKFIVLFDNDDKDGKNAGQDGAKIAVTALLNAGYPAVNRVLSDEKNVDANDILQRDGNEKLNEIIQKIIADSQEELHEVEKNIDKYRQNNDFNAEKPIHEELKLTDEQKKFLYSGEGYDLDNARRVAYLFNDKIRFLTDLYKWAKFQYWERAKLRHLPACFKNGGHSQD